jgi:two-component system chemotaxis response regulator CheB
MRLNPNIDTIVLGASAGGVEAIGRLVSQLPAELPAAILIVMHFPQSATSVLPAILSRRGPIRASLAQDGEQPQLGHIYVAQPGRHLLLEPDGMKLVMSAKENGTRPAIDPLFRSAAYSRGRRVVGVILSGMLDDGTLGLAVVRQFGGCGIVQDPEDAMFGDMPRNAIAGAGADFVLALDQIAGKIVELVGQPAGEPDMADPLDPSEMNLEELSLLEDTGRPSEFVCPDCQGTLYELSAGGVEYYRCRVGHSYLPESLSVMQESVLEEALWTALRAIKEHNELLARVLERSETRGHAHASKSFRIKLLEGERRLELLKRALDLTSVERGREGKQLGVE